MRVEPWRQASTIGLAGAVLALTLACAPGQRPGQGMPAGDPSIAGRITAASPASIRVEENPADPSGSDKAVVRITDDTRILLKDGTRARRTDLQVGRQVRVWFRGPVMESYPVQATAEVVVIEGEEES